MYYSVITLHSLPPPHTIKAKGGSFWAPPQEKLVESHGSSEASDCVPQETLTRTIVHPQPLATGQHNHMSVSACFWLVASVPGKQISAVTHRICLSLLTSRETFCLVTSGL